ncbi:hypothetical protein MMC07_002988, partial [Pseudocyphellaria aurata]|nr:hypothetical protein [Pseudocyphellaria aurata]
RLIPIALQPVQNRRDRAPVIAQVDDDLEDPSGILDHLLRRIMGERDAGAFGAEEVRDKDGREDAEGRVAAVHVIDDHVGGLLLEERELEDHGESGEEGGFPGADDVRAVRSQINGDSR